MKARGLPEAGTGWKDDEELAVLMNTVHFVRTKTGPYSLFVGPFKRDPLFNFSLLSHLLSFRTLFPGAWLTQELAEFRKHLSTLGF